MRRNTRRELVTLVDRRIEQAAETLLNLAIAESEHPKEPELTIAVDEFIGQLDELVRLRVNLDRLHR